MFNIIILILTFGEKFLAFINNMPKARKLKIPIIIVTILGCLGLAYWQYTIDLKEENAMEKIERENKELREDLLRLEGQIDRIDERTSK